MRTGMGLTAVAVVCLAILADPASALAQRRGGRGGAAAAAARRQQMISQLQMQLTQLQQVLASAEMTISDAQSQVSTANDRIEGARKSISDAKSGALESSKSQKSIEAEILSAQSEDSEYAKANLAFLEAQEDLKVAQDRVLASDAYQAEKAAVLKAPDHAAKLSKLQHDALADDPGYMAARDKLKAARVVVNHVKMDLFKANSDWVAATAAAKDAQSEETKANSEATRGAMKKLPAMRNLREAQAVADEARENIAAIQYQLKLLGAQPPKGSPTAYSATTANGK